MEGGEMNKKEIIRERLNCPVLGSIATTKTTYLVHASGLKVVTEFDCDNTHDCGVAIARTPIPGYLIGNFALNIQS